MNKNGGTSRRKFIALIGALYWIPAFAGINKVSGYNLNNLEETLDGRRYKMKPAKIYFVTAGISGGGSVGVVDTDGSNMRTLVSGEDAVEPDCVDVDIEGGKIYWNDMGKGGAMDKSVKTNDARILRADLDGKNVEIVVPLGVTTTTKQMVLDVKGGKIYWSDRGDLGDESVNPKIMRSNLDGSEIEIIFSAELKSPVGIALDVSKGKVYFSDRYANTIKRINLDGSGVEVVVKKTEYPVDLALDLKRRQIYWSARTEGAVYCADLDGSNIDGALLEPVITGLETPIGVALDHENGKIYYTQSFLSTKSGKISEADLDGKNARTVASPPFPLGIAFSRS